MRLNILAGLMVSTSIVLLGNPSSAEMIQKLGSCPSGTSSAGSGYCKINNGKQYIPKFSSCPSGTSSAGSGYCRVNNGKQYIPKQGSCPSGSSSAGSGYCMVR